MPNRGLKFFRLSYRDKGSFCEAILLLGMARIAIAAVHFRQIAKVLGEHKKLSPAKSEKSDASKVREVCLAVARASKNMPWECKCLVQAIAAKIMLDRRGVKSTVYFGVAKDDESDLSAHAWVRTGSRIITGANGASRFTIVSTFS